MKYYAITSGDPNGIGLEVATKALLKMGPQKGVRFVLFRSQEVALRARALSSAGFKIESAQTEDQVFGGYGSSSNILIDFSHSLLAPFWVEQAARLCMQKRFSGLITGPLSKTLIQRCGFKAKGHTEILQKVAKTKHVHMVFVGDSFSVLLATGHQPLAKVPQLLTPATLRLALERSLQLRELLPKGLRRKPVGLLGLNPHAGEGGILGHEEQRVMQPILKEFREVAGPLSPDAAFLKENWGRYSVFVACYHDQGLIPFKMVHGAESGYHLTFGLPFLRTSVDHGTAFDIYGKNRANPSSMIDAIKACLQLSR